MRQVLNVAALTVVVLLVASMTGRPATMQELEIATSVSMLEGPTVDADGNVYFTDILMQRIMRFSSKGEFSIFRENSNAANGLVIDPQGRTVPGVSHRRTGGPTKRRVPRVGCWTVRTAPLAVAWGCS